MTEELSPSTSKKFSFTERERRLLDLIKVKLEETNDSVKVNLNGEDEDDRVPTLSQEIEKELLKYRSVEELDESQTSDSKIDSFEESRTSIETFGKNDQQRISIQGNGDQDQEDSRSMRDEEENPKHKKTFQAAARCIIAGYKIVSISGEVESDQFGNRFISQDDQIARQFQLKNLNGNEKKGETESETDEENNETKDSIEFEKQSLEEEERKVEAKRESFDNESQIPLERSKTLEKGSSSIFSRKGTLRKKDKGDQYVKEQKKKQKDGLEKNKSIKRSIVKKFRKAKDEKEKEEETVETVEEPKTDLPSNESSPEKTGNKVESVEWKMSTQALKSSVAKSQKNKQKLAFNLFGATSSVIAGLRAAKHTEGVVESIEESKGKVISSGSISALIEAFLSPSSLPLDYLLEFLATHRFFMSSIKLLQHLVVRYRNLKIDGDGDSTLSSEDYSNPSINIYSLSPKSLALIDSDIIQLRILLVIKIWVTRHPSDFGHNGIVDGALLTFFKKDLSSLKPHQEEATEILAILKKYQDSQEDHLPLVRVPSAQKKLASLSSLSGLLTSEYVLVDQLTLLETKLFQAIPESEFHFVVKKINSIPHINAMEFWSKRVTSWISHLICSTEDLKARTDLLKFFISCGKYSLTLQNFNTLNEIVDALSMSPIQRLVKTWKNLPNKYKSYWLELIEIVSPSENYLLYRELLRRCNDKELPIFKVYLKDLEYASNRMPTNTSDGCIYFYKFHVIGSVLNSVKYCQKHLSNFNIEEDQEIQKLLKTIPLFEIGDSLIDLSREREPTSKGVQVEPIFGTDLNEIVEKSGVVSPQGTGMIPIILREMIKELMKDDRIETSGIFRKPGSRALIDKSRQEINSTNSYSCLRQLGVHEVAGVFKNFFLELPNPLFTSELYKNFLAVSNLPCKKDRIEALRLLFSFLPDAHKDTAVCMLNFLHLVSTFKESNLMDTKNLAIIFSPSLFGKLRTKESKNAKKPSALEDHLRKQAQASLALELMIENYLEITNPVDSEYDSIPIDYSKPKNRAVLATELNI